MALIYKDMEDFGEEDTEVLEDLERSRERSRKDVKSVLNKSKLRKQDLDELFME
ncbi:hypothetical protein HZB02_02125 [Candidatus Woesearchaeota archaeon]|nr:hypothetical protein [Candidatus Woesearchaeota archaeon]